MAEMSQREAYGRALRALGEQNSAIVVLDADTSASTLSSFFRDQFPERFFNIGIAEPCMVDVGVGLALGGLIPFVNGFSCLLSLRAVEAVRSNLCYARANVKLAASYAGLSDYKDGPSHHAITDIAILRALPEMTLLVPADANQCAAFVPLMAELDGPVAMRINRSATLPVHGADEPLTIGKGIQRRTGEDLVIIACGSMVGRSLQAAELLASRGVQAAVLDLPTIKPIDVNLICQTAAQTGAVVTVEEHSIIGGLGSAVAEVLTEHLSTPMTRVGLQDCFASTGLDADTLMDAWGLSVKDIIQAAFEVLKKKENR